MRVNEVHFSIARHAAWAPGLNTLDAWQAWAAAPHLIASGEEAPVRQLAPMLRRRAGTLGRMALEVAYQCMEGLADVPTVFCSRHGEVARAVGLLLDLARDEPLSPTAFGLAVHNANAGLFSIARGERSNHIAIAAGSATVEHAVIEACGLLADGATMVLLVACDASLPPPLEQFEECDEQPHAWAWLMVPAAERANGLAWRADPDAQASASQPGALEVLQFQISGQARMERAAERRRWTWTRDD